MKMKLTLFCVLALAAVALAEDEEQNIESGGEQEEIKIEIITPPPEDCERKSKQNDNLAMHYVGTLQKDGTEFDSSFSRGKPFEFQLGAGQVIKGWDEGLTDMCVGEKRKLTIPASKGYGSRGAGDAIPPNAGLVFEVELMEIKDGAPPPNVFKAIDKDNDNQLSQEEVAQYLKEAAAQYAPEGEEESTDEQHKDMITQIFQHEDQDKDGYISHEEFSGPKHDEL